jgi:Acyl-CoA hydrolase
MTEDKKFYKTPRFSQTTITELMIPSYANFGGKIHGGILLSLMDKAAYACASKHSQGYCVTVSVDTVDFLQPIEVGELVALIASVHYVGNSSMVIGIKVIAENVHTATVRHTNTSYFTMVSKDETDQIKKVPGLILETKEEVKNFLDAMKRKEIKDFYKKELKKLGEQPHSEEQDIEILKHERCHVVH